MGKQYFYLVNASTEDKTNFKVFLDDTHAIRWGRREATKNPYSVVSLYKQPMTTGGTFEYVKSLKPYEDTKYIYPNKVKNSIKDTKGFCEETFIEYLNSLDYEKCDVVEGYCVTFTYLGREYYAELYHFSDLKNKCTIFPKNVEISKDDLYTKFIDTLSIDDLKRCILNFVKTLKPCDKVKDERPTFNKEAFSKYLDTLTYEEGKSRQAYCTYFTFNGKEYYADLTVLSYSHNIECMIFHSENHEVTDWAYECYVNYPSEVSIPALKQCILDFVSNLNK